MRNLHILEPINSFPLLTDIKGLSLVTLTKLYVFSLQIWKYFQNVVTTNFKNTDVLSTMAVKVLKQTMKRCRIKLLTFIA